MPFLSPPASRHAGAALLSLLLLFPAPSTAQPDTGIRGRVTDPSGAVVAGAVVMLTGAGIERQVVSGPAGEFSLAALPPGDYVISADAPGFATAVQSVTAAAGRTAFLDLHLFVASVLESVRVIPGRIAGTPEEIARIPGSVDVLDRATLESARVMTTNEALRKVAGVTVRDEEGFGLRPNIGIRGTNPTRSTRVLLLEDGLPLAYAPYGDNASYYHPPIERFESIEVLKGAGQIAYGPMTVGGVINYITQLPPKRSSGAASLTLGNRDYLNGHASYGTTLGRTGVLFDYMRKQGDGARDNTASELDDVNGKAVFLLGKAQTFTVRGNYYGEESNVTYSGLREDEYRANPRGNDFANDIFYIDRGGASATHLWAPRGGVALSTSVYGSVFDRRWWRQSSNSGQRPNDAADPACGGMANLLSTCGNEGRLRTYSTWGVEPRLHATHAVLGAQAETDLGVRVHSERQERLQKNGAFPTARDGMLVEDNQRLNTAYSAFAQQRLQLDRWTITPGLRIEHVLYERTNRLNGARGDTTVTALIPGIGVAHAPNDRFMWFTGAHRGFAPPRTEDIISNTTGGSVDLDPELSWNFELGGRSELRPGVKVDATVFRMDYENQVIPASLAGGVGATLTNGGATLHQGAETSVRVDSAPLLGTTRNLYVRAAVTWLPIARFEGTRFSNVRGFSAVSVSGNRLPYAPELTTTITLGYATSDRFDAMLEAVHVGEQFGDDLNTVAATADGQRGLIPANTVWNASANYRLPRLGATLFATVKNLGDTLYIVDRSRGILPGLPRLVQLGVKVRF